MFAAAYSCKRGDKNPIKENVDYRLEQIVNLDFTNFSLFRIDKRLFEHRPPLGAGDTERPHGAVGRTSFWFTSGLTSCKLCRRVIQFPIESLRVGH